METVLTIAAGVFLVIVAIGMAIIVIVTVACIVYWLLSHLKM